VALTAAIIFWSTGPIGTASATDVFTPDAATVCNGQTTTIRGTVNSVSNTTIYYNVPINSGTVSPASQFVNTNQAVSFSYTAPPTGTGSVQISIGTSPGAVNVGTALVSVNCSGGIGTGSVAAYPSCVANNGTTTISGTVNVTAGTPVYLTSPQGGVVSPSVVTASPNISATYTAPASGTGTAAIYLGRTQGASDLGQVLIQVGAAGCTGSTGSSFYCQPATYNAQLCASSNSSYYCQVATYNAALCAQSSGTGNSYYCQPATYNAQLCAQGTGTNTWATVSPATVNCGGTATITGTPPGVQPGAILQFIASQGSVTPSTQSYNGYSVSAVYTAPVSATSNVVTITVSGAAVSTTATVNLTCGTNGAVSGAITVSAVPTSLNCGSSSFITAVTNAPGSSVSLTTTIGTISPTTAVDQGGGVLAVLTAPQGQGGTATVRATSGGASGQATVQINCNTAPTPVPTSAAAPPPPPPPPPPAPIVISPPNTGDGGLLGK